MIVLELKKTISYMSMKQGRLFIISAPSGAGKTSLISHVTDMRSDIKVSISHTTRLPRPKEKDGVDYFFIQKNEFDEMICKDEFIEHAIIYDHKYGTSRKSVKKITDAGLHVILEIDWQGAAQVRKQFSSTTSIFILPPSMQDLEDRLKKRAQDDDKTISRRLTFAKNEIKHCIDFDYFIINQDFDISVRELLSIIDSEKNKISNLNYSDVLTKLLN